jgi:fatty acid desaturase
MVISLAFLLTAPFFGIRLPGWMMIILAAVDLVFIGIFYAILFRSSSQKMLRWIFVLTNILLTLILLALIAGSLLVK